MADELETGSPERSLDGDDTAKPVCPVEMDRVVPKCGRPLHNAKEDLDQHAVCLMHSMDPNKGAGELFEAFWREFEVILEAPAEDEAHFEGFSFPKLWLVDRRIEAVCRFKGATFTQGADFHGATFMRDADFSRATFTQDANFDGTTFTQDANFDGATVTQDADFNDATFGQNANFLGAEFTQNAIFSDASFTQGAFFIFATFTQDAYFTRAIFMQVADFTGATFTENAEFEETSFRGTAWLVGCRFLESAAFRRTKFDPQVAGIPGGLFALASLSCPRKVIFDDVDLSRTLFQNCDVSEVWFTSSVRWAKRGSHGIAVFEESIPLEQATGLRRDGKRDYRAIAQIYQQLKKNYDTRLDYWTANEFHFGEMEMKRLVAPAKGRLLWLRRWVNPRLGLTALYRYASDYGNNYLKPMLWFLAVLSLFAVLFPLPGAGLRQTGASYTETYISVWQSGAPLKKSLQWVIGLLGKSVLVAVDMATFQRNPEYAPAYPWGRVLAIAETLLTSTLFGLFLLAIRRQFRR